jgi:hypothetical protein
MIPFFWLASLPSGPPSLVHLVMPNPSAQLFITWACLLCSPICDPQVSPYLRRAHSPRSPLRECPWSLSRSPSVAQAPFHPRSTLRSPSRLGSFLQPLPDPSAASQRPSATWLPSASIGPIRPPMRRLSIRGGVALLCFYSALLWVRGGAVVHCYWSALLCTAVACWWCALLFWSALWCYLSARFLPSTIDTQQISECRSPTLLFFLWSLMVHLITENGLFLSKL